MKWLIALGIAACPAAAEAQGSPGPASWPAPKHQVRLEKTVMVPMRDGVKLATDLYFPIGAGEKLPVILVRTPYDKRPWRLEGSRFTPSYQFAGQGYVVAVQDVRGKFESEGIYTYHGRHDQDG